MKTSEFLQNFNPRADAVFQDKIRPFIARELEKLKDFDRQRMAWAKDNLPADYKMSYIFEEHTMRVSKDMRAAALHMGLPENTAETLYWAMLPHDIGKRMLPLHLWDMMKKPQDDIKRLRRRHTDEGAKLAREALPFSHPFLDLMLDIMLNHHEQMDGGGYRGLKGDQLSAPVRLACIVESFDGYSIARPHFGERDVSPAGVLARMREEKGPALYDMDLFEQFAAMKMKGNLS
jgi:HD-GYP domain-containing protein (c-di-GMP phosphodiesterase class II)